MKTTSESDLHTGDPKILPGEQMLDIEHSLPVLVTMLANKIATTGSATFRARHGLGATDWKTLAMMATLPAGSAAEVADLLAIDRAAISRALRSLADKGLVHIAKAGGKGNGQSVRLTQTGRELHGEALVTAWQREQMLVEGVSVAERQVLIEVLRKMLSNIPAVSRLVNTPPPTRLPDEGLEHLAHRAGTTTA